MPKVNFNFNQKEKQQSSFFSNKMKEKTNDPIFLERALRKKRTSSYVEALGQLDTQGVTDNKQKIDQIIEAVSQEFPEIVLGGLLIGFVSKCYLGNPYEVHSLSYSLQIVDHYKTSELLPDGMEKARVLAAFGDYAFIEVYTDCCRAVASDGSVSVIQN